MTDQPADRIVLVPLEEMVAIVKHWFGGDSIWDAGYECLQEMERKSKMVDSEMDHLAAISDGYHTFSDLYEHRHALFIALCRVGGERLWCWRSRLHSDGSMYEGWFVMGINKRPGHQITYHLPDRLWDKTSFAKTLDRAPEWDRHMPQDAIERIYSL